MASNIDPKSYLGNQAKIRALEPAEMIASRVITGAPNAFRDWDAAMEKYLNRHMSLEDTHGTPVAAETNMEVYPMAQWPYDNRIFVASCIEACTTYADEVTGFDSFKTALFNLIDAQYPDGGSDYWMFETDEVLMATDTEDPDVDPAAYTADDDITGGSVETHATAIALMKVLNNLIYQYRAATSADDIKQLVAFAVPEVGIIVSKVYTIFLFLRDQTDLSAAVTGNYLSTAQMNALAAVYTEFAIRT